MVMGRPLVVSDEEVLARARAVFLEHGYAATTLRVASAVGISWGAIARRFVSKRALFTRALKSPAGAADEAAFRQDGAEDLPTLLERLTAELWERWPRHLQYRLATPCEETDSESAVFLGQLTAAIGAQARIGRIRADLAEHELARIVFTLLTGDVAQRFMAREQTLSVDRGFIEGVVSLLSAH
jgi:AcrR family transcriptional regulator